MVEKKKDPNLIYFGGKGHKPKYQTSHAKPAEQNGDPKKDSKLREFLEMPVNIWSEVVYDLHKKIRDILDGLEKDGQIDHDPHGHPFVFGVERVGGNNWRVDLLRNGRRENIILNTRKRAEPIMSFNSKDGWKRIDLPRLGVDNPNAPRPERQKRFEARALVNRIIEGS